MNLAFRLGAAPPAPGAAAMPASLRVNPRLSRWVALDPDGTVRVFPGKVEIGQGINTALAQIVADELETGLDRVRMMPVCTATSPDEGVTSGSLSVQECGAALAQVGAQLRARLVEAAARRWSVPAAQLHAREGCVVCADGRALSYGALAGEVDLEVDLSAPVALKHAAARTLRGTPAPRLDLPDKVFGAPCFIHDLVLPAMAHGRVLRPPSPGARVQACELAGVNALPGVIATVRDGDFLGVVAATEHAAGVAVAAIARAVSWRETASLPPADSVGQWLVAQPCDTTTVAESAGASESGSASIDASAGEDGSARTGPNTNANPGWREFAAVYEKPFIAHASIGLSCALALRADGHAGPALRVWSHTQGPYNLRADLALAFGLAPEDVVVEHAQGAGCYGHNPADDVAYDAARLAAAVPGVPVRVLWSRADELSWGPFGPAMRVELRARVDDTGRLRGWSHEVWSNGHSIRPGRAPTPTLLGSWHAHPPAPALPAVNAPLAAGGGAERNAVPGYEVGALRVRSHRVLTMPLRSSALRSLGAFANVFAAESFIDEIARGTGADPLAFRLAHLADARGRAVLERAAAAARWGSPLAGGAGESDARREAREGSGRGATHEGSVARGRGIGYARYKNTGAWCAVVAEVQVDAQVRVRRLVIAVDAGAVVNPDGLANQIEGGAIQATSWALKEEVAFDRTRVLSDSWERYPILGFAEAPEVEVAILDQPGEPSLGAGEASLGPTAAAIANAVCDAIGVRVRALPITPQRVVDAMA